MDEPPGRFLRFFQELKRRNVYRVAVTYAVVAFVAIQAADLLVPQTTLPAWSDQLLIYLAVFGFPIALVLAWAFEMTPEGVRRTPAAEPVEAEGAPEAARSRSRLALKVLVGLGLLAVAGVAGWYLMGGGGETEPRAGDRSIAVLPFDNLSGTEEAEPFVNGIHDDLLTRLSNVSGLRVISRTSVLPYRNSELSLPAIADSLGVAWIVEGGVQQAGGQVRVNAQLIQAEEDAHRWAESYQRELSTENLFAIQSELTKKIARSLEAELTPEEEEQVERQPTESLEAYRLYVEARALLKQRTPTEMERATELFERAIMRDSSYALAWAGLADALVLRDWYGFSLPDTAPDPRQVARHALELNPRLAEAHASLGLLHSFQVRGPLAVRQLERAVELRPSYVQAQGWLCFVYLLVGHPDRALEAAERAAALNPPPETRIELSEAYLATGDAEKALRQAQQARRISPENDLFHLVEGIALYQLGKFQKAIAVLMPRSATFNRSGHRATVALARVAVGDSGRARALLTQIQKGGESPFWEGLVHAALGEADEAFLAFRRVDRWSAWPTLPFRYYYPNVLGPLRDDPRYQELLREVNEYWGLNPDGSLPDSVDVSFEIQSDD